MPQIKKNKRIIFKPSDTTLTALAFLQKLSPDKTKTALIEAAIQFFAAQKEKENPQSQGTSEA